MIKIRCECESRGSTEEEEEEDKEQSKLRIKHKHANRKDIHFFRLHTMDHEIEPQAADIRDTLEKKQPIDGDDDHRQCGRRLEGQKRELVEQVELDRLRVGGGGETRREEDKSLG